MDMDDQGESREQVRSTEMPLPGDDAQRASRAPYFYEEETVDVLGPG